MDEEVVYNIVAATCIALMTRFQKFIEDRREHQSAYLSEAEEVVVKRWKARREFGGKAVLPELKPYPGGV